MKRFFGIVVLLMSIVIFVAACGGRDTEQTPYTTEASQDIQPTTDASTETIQTQPPHNLAEEELILGGWIVVDIIDDYSTPEEIAEELSEITYRFFFMPFNMGMYWVELIGEPNDSDIIPTFSWSVNNGLITMTSDTTGVTVVYEYSFDNDLLVMFDPIINETLVFERISE
ncbi:MAG: hypothetical protein FWE44_05590 [Defluviitaleaceae bacterium]|nr:hypothetical protein [Defluviitaleaceae bacterium]